jgi:hypothetical protein
MEFTRVLRYQFPLTRGDDVRAVQQALTALDVSPPCGTADGVYGEATRASVEAFQARWNVQRPAGTAPLDVDGAVGPATWSALFATARTAGTAAPQVAAAAAALPDIARELPITEAKVGPLKRWMMGNFGPQIVAAVAGTPIDPDLVCAIAAKESSIYWLGFIDRIAPADLLALCVFDASGDFPGTRRNAFPVNAAALRDDPHFVGLADMLIAEANKMRRVLHGWAPAGYLYKGYGIFQYDLQHVRDDEAFFRDREWYSFASCMERLMREMRTKLQATGGDLERAVRAYNGSGPRADIYVRDVMLIRQWCAAQPA